MEGWGLRNVFKSLGAQGGLGDIQGFGRGGGGLEPPSPSPVSALDGGTPSGSTLVVVLERMMSLPIPVIRCLKCEFGLYYPSLHFVSHAQRAIRSRD